MEKLSRKTYYKPDENIIKKMKDTFYNCPTAVSYCRSLKIPEEVMNENIDILYDFASDVNYCKKCPGIDNCIKENQLLVTKVVYDDGILERQLTPCKKLLEKMKLKNQFMVMDFDADWLNKELKQLDSNAGRNKALKKYVAFCKHKSDEWLYLTGEKNTGRSFVAANLAIDLARKEIGPIAFINCPILLFTNGQRTPFVNFFDGNTIIRMEIGIIIIYNVFIRKHKGAKMQFSRYIRTLDWYYHFKRICRENLSEASLSTLEVVN